MRRALLIGFYGKSNLGDDAFFKITAWGARTFCKVDEVLVYASSPLPAIGFPSRTLFSPSPFRYTGPLRRLIAAWRCRNIEHVILGGGSILHTAESMQRIRRLIERAGPGPHFAVGVSVGPFRDFQAASCCKALLDRLHFVGLRDNASLERAASIAPSAPLKLTFDLAPLLWQASGNPSPSSRSRRGLGVALCNYERFVKGDRNLEGRRLHVVAAAINALVGSRLLDKVVLLDCCSHSLYGDHEVHSALARLLDSRLEVRHVPYLGDPLKVAEEISCLRGILAMRLHAAVFAFCTNTPAVMLAYHEKCTEWASTIGQPVDRVLASASVDTETLSSALRHLLSESPPALRLDASSALARALQNWAWLRCTI